MDDLREGIANELGTMFAEYTGYGLLDETYSRYTDNIISLFTDAIRDGIGELMGGDLYLLNLSSFTEEEPK